MMPKIIVAAIAVVVLFALGLTAQAQVQCGSRAAIVDKLTREISRGGYGEHRVGVGSAGRGSIFELWANPDTGTWSITRMMPNGLVCMMAVGEGWEADAPEEPGEPT